MAIELLEHYLGHWFFVVIHGALIAAAGWTYLSARARIRGHVRVLTAQCEALEGADDDARRSSPKVDANARDPWSELARRHAVANRPAFAEIRTHYGALLGGALDALSRVANMFLLSGVAGTLYGLYASASGGGDQAWTASLATSFDAFGVTIVAVCLAAFVMILQHALARTCDRAAVTIAGAWDHGRALDAQDPTAGAARVVEKLESLIGMFAPIVTRMEAQTDRLANDAKSLDQIAASCMLLKYSCDDIKQSFDELPARLRDGMAAREASYLDGLRTHAEVMASHQASALTAVQRVTAAADEAHARHLAGLHHLREKNEQLFADVRETNERAFKAIQADIANFSEHLKSVDSDVATSVGAFTGRLTTMLTAQLNGLEHKLAALVDVVPQVERNLQELTPSAAAASQALTTLETSAVRSVEQVQHAVESLAGGLGRMEAKLHQVIELHVDTSAPTAPPPPPVVVPPVPTSGRTVVLGLAAGVLGTFLTWVFLRVSS